MVLLFPGPPGSPEAGSLVVFTPAAPWGSTALGVSRAKLCREETEGDDEAVDDAHRVHGSPRSAAEAVGSKVSRLCPVVLSPLRGVGERGSEWRG